MGQDILTDCGIKAVSKLENCKTGELPRNDKSGDQVVGLWPQSSFKESNREEARKEANISYKSASRVSSYDTVAVPYSIE